MRSQPQLVMCHVTLFLNEKLPFVIHCKVILTLQSKQRKKCLDSGSQLYQLRNHRSKTDEPLSDLIFTSFETCLNSLLFLLHISTKEMTQKLYTMVIWILESWDSCLPICWWVVSCQGGKEPCQGTRNVLRCIVCFHTWNSQQPSYLF